jgi:hypothetical protein
MKRAIVSFLAVAALAVVGCAGETDGSDDAPVGSDDDMEVIARDPLAMPKPILTFLSTNKWGKHHLEWHTVRQWDRLRPSDQAWAKRQHWARADIQEGAKGNGLEFLAMHRVMIRMLTEKFPDSKDLFVGWQSPPTDPNDKVDPLPNGGADAFDANKLQAIDKLQNHLADFKDDDELGLFIETSLRPTAKDPNARATDKAVGIHNYLHVRWMDQNSKIDIGDPSVNLQNKRFWRIHGWLESRWTEFRKIKKLSEDDPAYRAAIEKAEVMLDPGTVKGPIGGQPDEPPPASLRKFFEQDP